MRADLHTFAGAYALDALPDEDRRLFEGHLDRCAACAAEVRGLQATAARLGAAAAEPPPPRLRAAVLDQIGQVRQLAPARSGDPSDAPGRREAARRGVRWSRWRLKISAGLAAAAVAASVAVAVVANNAADRTHQRLEQAEAANRAVAAVLSAPDARTVASPVAGGGTATVVVSRSRGQIVFAPAGLGPLPLSHTYELWLMGPGGVRPAGLLRPDPAGRTAPVIAGGLQDGDRVGLTVEPAAGSAQPTTDPVVIVPLA
jgi:anti-sigma-K factor RskA